MPGSPLSDRVRLFGIRHHGPGSSRSLIAALDSWHPNAVIIEGAPETEALIPHLLDPEVKMPVAGLVYSIDQPRRAIYYPVAVFSPEYQAEETLLEQAESYLKNIDITNEFEDAINDFYELI